MNKAIYTKCKKVILRKLRCEFPKPVDIDFLYIEGENVPKHERKLCNYDDAIKSWDNGFSSGNDPIQPELNLYKDTINSMVNEGLISHESVVAEDTRLYKRCKLTPNGEKKSDHILMIEPNFYGFGVRIRPLIDSIRVLFRKS